MAKCLAEKFVNVSMWRVSATVLSFHHDLGEKFASWPSLQAMAKALFGVCDLPPYRKGLNLSF
jgi:hypothetical protein